MFRRFVQSRSFCIAGAQPAPFKAAATPFITPLAATRWCSTSPSHVFNVFNGRAVRRDSPTIRSLERIGIGINETGSLDVVDGLTLNRFAEDVRAGEATIPSVWSKGMVDSLGTILQSEKITDPTEYTAQWISRLSRSTRSRRNTGTIAADDSEVTMEEEKVNLNAEQKAIIDLALQGHNLCISGNAGTGKTVLLRALRAALHKKQLSVAMTATTGIAGCHVGGTTFHHSLGVNTKNEFMKPQNLLKFDVVIIDEISMMTQRLFEEYDARMRAETGSQKPFGGVQIILCGDFLQLGAIPYTPVFRSHVFRQCFVPVRLEKQMRQSQHPKFVNALQSLRSGVVPDDLASTVNLTDKPELVEDAVNLLPTNEQVMEANQVELDRLDGELHVFSPAIQPPALEGEWTPTVVIRAGDRFNANHFREQFFGMLSRKTKLRENCLSFYKLDEDSYVLRVMLSMNETDAWRHAVRARFEELVQQIGGMQLDCIVISQMPNGDGYQTQENEEALERLIQKHPVVSPLELKIGARVLLRANISKDFVNGAVGTVVGFTTCEEENFPSQFLTTPVREHIHQYIMNQQLFEAGLPLVPVVQFGSAEGKTIAIPPWTFSVGGDASTNHYSNTALAIPLSLAYAFTVHKVQGLTLVGRVHLELSKMWPCEHLLYVAMSRVKQPEQLSMSCFNPDMVVADPEAVEFDSAIPGVKDVKIAPSTPVAMWREIGDQQKAMKGSATSAVSIGSRSRHKHLSKTMRAMSARVAQQRQNRLKATAALAAEEEA